MKRVFVVFILIICFCLTACSNTTKDDTQEQLKESFDDYFTIISYFDGYMIIYANDTRVKYFMINSPMNSKFGITPLYNADGTLQVYGLSEKTK